MRLAYALVAMVALVGCESSGTTEPNTVIVEPNDPLSTLTVRWSLAGSIDPAACAQSGASVIDVAITDPVSGGALEVFQQDCGTFATSITLAPGTYAASARLVDAAGDDRTTAVAIAPFTLAGNDELIQTVDFPADSFF